MKKSRKKRLRRLAERVVDRHRRRQQQGEVSGVILKSFPISTAMCLSRQNLSMVQLTAIRFK